MDFASLNMAVNSVRHSFLCNNVMYLKQKYTSVSNVQIII